MIYPPYCDICVTAVRSSSRQNAQSAVNEVFSNIKQMISDGYSDVKVIILGPAPAQIPVVNNKYRFRMIIKCRAGKRFREMLRKAIDIKLTGDTAVAVDINPETVI